MIRRRSRRAGFTLVEIVVVMFALGILVASGTVMVLAATKAAALTDAATEEFGRLTELSRLFRADVGGASEMPDKLGDVVAGREALILRRADGSTVVYRMVEGKLERRERRSDDERTMRFGFNSLKVVVEFSRPSEPEKAKEKGKGGENLVTLRLTSPRVQSGRVTEIKAALGGARR